MLHLEGDGLTSRQRDEGAPEAEEVARCASGCPPPPCRVPSLAAPPAGPPGSRRGSTRSGTDGRGPGCGAALPSPDPLLGVDLQVHPLGRRRPKLDDQGLVPRPVGGETGNVAQGDPGLRALLGRVERDRLQELTVGLTGAAGPDTRRDRQQKQGHDGERERRTLRHAVTSSDAHDTLPDWWRRRPDPRATYCPKRARSIGHRNRGMKRPPVAAFVSRHVSSCDHAPAGPRGKSMSDTATITPEPPAEPPAPPVTPKASWPRKLLSLFWNREERRVRRSGGCHAGGRGGRRGLAIRATGLLPQRGTREFYVVGGALRLLAGARRRLAGGLAPRPTPLPRLRLLPGPRMVGGPRLRPGPGRGPDDRGLSGGVGPRVGHRDRHARTSVPGEAFGRPS